MEISEVEYQLRECLPATVESIVAMVTPKRGEKLLAAFLVVKNGSEERTDAIARTPDDLKQFQELMDGVEKKLQLLLPSYMVPSVYAPIYKIPLSASRKADRRRLQHLVSEMTSDELSSLRGAKTSKFKPSSSIMEKRIQSLWAATLNVGQIGVDDNFFQLGGDSLSAMRLVSIARKQGITMTVDQIFKNPTLSAMALTSFEKSPAKTMDVPPFSLIKPRDFEALCSEAVLQCNIRREQIQDMYPCTYYQGVWIGIPDKNSVPAASTIEQAQILFSLPRDFDLDRFRAALSSLVSRHVILRSRVIQSDSEVFQVVVDEPTQLFIAKSVDEYLQRDREDIIRCGDRLLRYCFIQDEATNERYFVWTASHACYDGWTLDLFFKELEAIYLRGAPLEQKPSITMNKFIKYIGEIDRVAASNFFRSHLADAVTKPLVQVPDGRVQFDCTLATKIIQLPKRQSSDITQAMMYKAAWGIVIGRTLGVTDVVFDTVLAGRNVPVSGIEALVGPTATQIFVRVYIEADQKVQDLLQCLREAQIKSMPFEHLGQHALMKMVPEVEPVISNAIKLNILPFMDIEKLGDGIGLKMKHSFVTFEVPFYISCEPSEDSLNLSVMADKSIISDQLVDSLMRRFEHVLLQIIAAHSDPEKRIADIDASEFPDPNWSCTRSPWDWMTEA